ncbi:MAG TPA: hypothetical protein PKK51_12355 [Rhodocyclaceae bacterium]|nr:hypothetical protein [Rhodocyclaceae bacterium]
MLLIAGLVSCGCVSGPMVENPVPLLAPPPGAVASSPVFLPQSAQGYPRVFEKCLDVISDYWEIDPAGTNRYAGVIRTKPSIAPGIEQPWKPGSPDLYQRLLAFKQTIRHRAVVEIAASPAVAGVGVALSLLIGLLACAVPAIQSAFQSLPQGFRADAVDMDLFGVRIHFPPANLDTPKPPQGRGSTWLTWQSVPRTLPFVAGRSTRVIPFLDRYYRYS